jgi:ABC-type antimicrobial peptide transport system permease subunit
LSGVQAVIPVIQPMLTAAQSDDSAGVQTDGTTGFVTEKEWAQLGGAPTETDGSGYVTLDNNQISQGYLQAVDSSAAPGTGMGELVVLTDGQQSTVERVRTALEVATPNGPLPYSFAELDADQNALFRLLARLVNVGVILCLIIAGCSLAVSIAGSLVERRRAFALLRLTGMPVGHLYRAVIMEAAVPLLLAALTSALVGFFVASLIVWTTGGGWTVAAPGVSYFIMVIGGIVGALAIVGLTLPLVGRMTEPETARME